MEEIAAVLTREGDRRPHTNVEVGEKKIDALLDTGAATSCVAEETVENLPESHVTWVNGDKARLVSANGTPLELKGKVRLRMKVLNTEVEREFYVVSNLGRHKMIIGIDMIIEMRITIVGNECMLNHPVAWEVATLHAEEPFVVPAGSIMHRRLKMKIGGHKIKPGETGLVQATFPNPFAWEGLQKVQDDGAVVVVFGNTSDHNILVTPQMAVARLEKLPEQEFREATDKEIAAVISNMGRIKPDPPEPHKGAARPMTKEEKASFLEKLKLRCPEKWKARYEELCLKFHDVFSKSKFDLGRCNTIEHSIRVKEEEPVHVKQFPLPYADRETAKEWVQELLKQGAIEVSRSAYNSPLFFVKKQNGGKRAVLDFRKLNSASLPDKYIIREIRECIDEVGQAESKVFSAIDLTSGFWQQVLEKRSRELTAFTVPGGARYQWTVTPMGLQGSPASFARLMDHVVRGLEDVIAYIDDVLAHSKNHEEHLQCLERLFLRFRRFNLKMQPGKSIFGADSLQYLGYKLTGEGVGPGDDKTKAIREYQCPNSVKKIREFLGMANYFRFLIPNFAKNAGAMSALLQKASGYKKGEMPPAAREGFENIRNALMLQPIVRHPSKRGEYHLTTDASQGDKDHPGGVGAVLSQFVDGQERVIAYASRSLKSFEKNYPAYLLELAAAEWAIDHFYKQLSGRHFKLWTDHKPLLALSTVHKKTLNRLQQQMLEHDFVLGYKAGETNVIADALSRNPVSKAEEDEAREKSVAVLTDASGDLAAAQKEDQMCQDVKRFKTDGFLPGHSKAYANKVKKMADDCKEEDGVLYFWLRRDGHRTKWVAVVPENLKETITNAAHSTWFGGHGGAARTANRIMQDYYWPGIHTFVERFVARCPRCQAKSNKKPPPSPLCSLPICEGPNERVHMDLFGPMKSAANGNKYVNVMTDAYTKVVELDAIPDKSAETVARSFFERWICRYSVPIQLVTDNGKEFSNELLNELCKLLGIKHKTTTAYHPASNSSAESFNRSMKKYLTAMLDNDKTLDWEAQLPMLQLSYNTHVHQSTLESPFWLTYHMDPRLPYFDLEKPKPLYNAQAAPALFQSLSETHKKVHQEQWKARDLREEYYNRKAKERSFEPGDRVLFYNNAVPKNVNAKFYKHWQGPYVITKKLSPLNYVIRETNRSKEKVVHIEKLKHLQEAGQKKLQNSTEVQSQQLPEEEEVRRADRLADDLQKEHPPLLLSEELKKEEEELQEQKKKGESTSADGGRLTRARAKATGEKPGPAYSGRRY